MVLTIEISALETILKNSSVSVLGEVGHNTMAIRIQDGRVIAERLTTPGLRLVEFDPNTAE